MKKLLLAALMFAGFATFAGVPTIVVEVAGENVAVKDEGDTNRIVNSQPGKRICCCFPVDDEQSVKVTLSVKKAAFGLRPSLGVGTFEVKSFKVNGKELLGAPVMISANQRLSEKLEAEAADGTMVVELLVRDAE